MEPITEPIEAQSSRGQPQRPPMQQQRRKNQHHLPRSISFDANNLASTPRASSSRRPNLAPIDTESPSPVASTSYHPSAFTAAAIAANGSDYNARARSRSVGSKSRKATSTMPAGYSVGVHPDQDAAIAAAARTIGDDLDRGPGTPDFVLNPAARLSKGKGRVSQLVGSEDGVASLPAPSPVSTTAQSNYPKSNNSPLPTSASLASSSSHRPRLTTRLRSFFTSFAGDESATSALGTAKLRSSSEFERPDLSPSGSGQEVVDEPRRPKALVVPAARPGSFSGFGFMGLNEDSPPLTPTSDQDTDPARDPVNGFVRGELAHQSHPVRHLGGLESSSSGFSADAASTSGSSSVGMIPSPTTANAHALNMIHNGQGAMSLGTGGALAHSLRLGDFDSVSLKPVQSRIRRVLSVGEMGARLRAGLRSRSLRQHMPTLLMLLTFFVASTTVTVILLTTLPLKMPSHSLSQLSLAEIRDICLSLKSYAASTSHAYHHTLFVLSLFFVYKQAFNVPGSIISNIVFGALFGTWRATVFLSILTAVGGVGAAVMSALVAPLVLKVPGMTKGVNIVSKALGQQSNGRGSPSLRSARNNVSSPRRRSPAPRLHSPAERMASRSKSPAATRDGHKHHHHHRHHKSAGSSKGNLFSVLLLLRLLPLTPYGMMNIACGILNVPLIPFASTLALGSVPWNAVTAQLGEIVVEVVAALPGDAASASLANQLDSGGFRDASPPDSAASGAIHNVISSEKSRLSSAAQKAGGGVKILLAKIWTKEMMLKLIGLSLLSVTPILLGRWWKARQAANQAKSRKAAKAAAHAATESHGLAQLEPQRVADSYAHPTSQLSPNNLARNPAAAILEWSEGEESDFIDDDDADISSGTEDEDGDDESGRNDGNSFSFFADSGPALLADMTRSASRSSWNSSSWFRGVTPSTSSGRFSSDPSSSASRNSSPPSTAAFDSDAHSGVIGWPGRSDSLTGLKKPLTTPQLELANDPFDAMAISHPSLGSVGITPASPSSKAGRHSRQPSSSGEEPGSGNTRKPMKFVAKVVNAP